MVRILTVALASIAFLTAGTPHVFAESESTPSGTSKNAARKPLIERLRENFHVSYWSMFSGPALESGLTESVNSEGERIAGGSFHMLWSGWRVNSKHTLGVLNRFAQDFTFTDENGERTQSIGSLRDPRLYWRVNGLVDNSWVNYTHEARVEIPTTDSAERAGRRTVIQSVHILNFKPKNTKFTPGVFAAASGFFNSIDPSLVNLAVGPYASYMLSPKWSIYAWTWFDADQRLGTPFGSLDGVGPAAGSDYFRIGPMYSPIPNIQLYPCVQAFVVNPRMETTTFGFELSAQL